MKSSSARAIGLIAAALGIGYLLTSKKSDSQAKPTLILPRLASAPGPVLTVITVDTTGFVREVIPQAWSGQSSVIELIVLDAKTNLPVAEAIAFPREQYDFKTLPKEVSNLLNTYFKVQWAP